MEDEFGEFSDLIERNTIAHIATVDPNGAPHVAPVWIGSGNETLHVVTQTTSQKYRHIKDNARVALSITDPDDPYRSVVIRGEVVETDIDAGLRRLDEFAREYWDLDEYPYDRDKEWALLRIRPDNIVTNDPDEYSE